MEYGKGEHCRVHVLVISSFFSGYDLANQTAYLDSMLRWGLDWLIKVRFRILHASGHTAHAKN